MNIKWIRLKNICCELTGLDVQIIASTHESNYRAFVRREGLIIEIYLNLKFAKTINDVIESLAHELAHVILDSDRHCNNFTIKMNELKNLIKEKYKEGTCV